jgi:signal transduction histidine kinase
VLADRLARARADLQRRGLEFDTLFRLTPIGIGVASDPACRDIRVNPAFAQMLGIEPEANASLSAPASQRPSTFHVERDGVTVAPEELPLQVAAQQGIEVKDAEFDVVYADGSRRTLYEYAAPLFDDDGTVRGAVGAFMDITALKQTEDRLRRLASENEQLYYSAHEANRLKDEFLATLSHELRTPLNALLGWIHLLRSGQLSPEKRQRALAAIERSAQLQAQLTSDLLDISGVITGKLRLQLEPTRLGPIVEDTIEALDPTAQAKGVTCRAQVHVDEPLMLDPARIQQILANLIGNAIKFTPRGGAVVATVRRDADDLVIEVCDTGMGIAPTFLPHVFERFRQADAGHWRPVGGLGLGLAIVKELAERHGGRVTAESAGIDQGATFIVRLPYRSTRPEPVQAPLSGTESPAGED